MSRILHWPARKFAYFFFFARRPVQCVTTPIHRRLFSVVPEIQNWADQQWRRMLFTDECRFRLTSDSGHMQMWRKREIQNHTSNISERDFF